MVDESEEEPEKKYLSQNELMGCSVENQGKSTLRNQTLEEHQKRIGNMCIGILKIEILIDMKLQSGFNILDTYY